MREAIAMWQGGKLIDATEGNYSAYKELGIKCPFCNEALFWRKAYSKGDTFYQSAWCHYSIKSNPVFCEARAVSGEGKELLNKLRPEAHYQRLITFNNYFWKIYCYKKDIPKNFHEILRDERIKSLADHCHKLWLPDVIKGNLRKTISELSDEDKILKSIRESVDFLSDKSDAELLGLWDKVAQRVKNVSPLNYKILCEVIDWLGTASAKPAFRKVATLAYTDVSSVTSTIRSQWVADTIINSLILTDWEESLQTIGKKASLTRGKGFG